jgi:hypothetical protein
LSCHPLVRATRVTTVTQSPCISGAEPVSVTSVE